MTSSGKIGGVLFGLGLFLLGGIGLGLLISEGRRPETDAALPVVQSPAETNASDRPVSFTRAIPVAHPDGSTGFADVAAQVTPAVVNVFSKRVIVTRDRSPFQSHPFYDFFGRRFPSVPRERRETSLGSGVIVDRSGIVLTNNHVVEGAEEIQIALADGRQFNARLLGTDPATDVAVLRVDADDLPTVPISNSDSARIGDIVLAIGNPFGLGQTVTMGIISATGRSDVGIVDYENFIQTDAAINPGNSGGALIDITGRLIGINTAIFSRTGGYQGIGFAIPINIANQVMLSITMTGGVQRGSLGLSFQDIDENIRRAFNLKDTRGALINQLTPDGPGEKAGLQRGDVIVGYAGQRVQDAADLRRRIALAQVGSSVEVTYNRGQQEARVKVTVGELATEYTYLAEDSEGWVSPIEGIVVEVLDRRAAQRAGLRSSTIGVVVKDILGRSPAAYSGLQVGDVILEMNREAVSSVDEFKRLLAKYEGKTVILLVSRNGRLYYLSLPA